jgi:tRNA pseudouridine55 synthase
MDGLLIVDKPVGPTSHDVVARLRRALGESRIGHTGTLDPMASGVLPLLLGRATRLAQFLNTSDKRYEAVVRLGVETDTCDALGCPVGAAYDGPLPSREAVERAIDAFRGSFLQQPPAFSAKKIGGRRSYRLARARARAAAQATLPALPDLPGLPDPRASPDLPDPPGLPAPVLVTAHAIDIVGMEGTAVSLAVECSAGFYIRALAHDLGRALGTGAHLSALMRTRSGDATIDQAVALDAAEREPERALACVLPLRALLPDLPSVVLSPQGLVHAGHGRDLGAADVAERHGEGPRVRLIDEAGELVGIAATGQVPGALHPSIILM